MNDLPRQKLAEIVARYGTAVCDDPRRCRALLMDLCGEYRREVFVLVSAAEESVAAELRAIQRGVPTELLLTRLTDRLVDNRALDEEAARWAVESWALALGIRLPPRSAQQARPRPATPEPARIDDRQLALLVRRLAGLSHAELPLAHSDVTDAGLAYLAALPNLTALDLFWCQRITDRGLAHLRGLTNLTRLDLTGTRITDAGLAHLSTLTNLTHLDLSQCERITDSGLAHLRGLRHLVELDLQGCKQVTARGVRALERPGLDILWP